MCKEKELTAQINDAFYKRDKEVINTIINMLISTNQFEEFKNIKEEELYLQHFGLGLWIRNKFSYDDYFSNRLVECVHELINRNSFCIDKFINES